MAKTFTLNSQSYGGRYLSLACEQIPHAETNTSTINWTLTVKGGSSNYYSTGPTTVTIFGSKVFYANRKSYSSYEFPSGPAGKSISGTLEVLHMDDGSRYVSCNISTAIYDTAVVSTDGVWYLDSIPQESTVSCTSAYIGAAPTITIKKASSAFIHTLKYKFGSLSGTIVEKTTASTYTDFVLPDSFYAQIPNSPSGTGTIICEAYNGNTLYGTSTCQFTANVNRAVSDPVISPTIRDTNETTKALTGDSSVLVRYYSNASVTTGASARNSASIVSQTVTNGSTTKEGATCTFDGVENGLFSFTIEDSRGFIVYPGRDLTVTGKFIEYFLPTCNLIEERPDASGNMTVRCNGIFFNGSFGAADNTLQAQYRYKTQGGAYGAWKDMTVSTSGDSYTAKATVTGLDYQSTYVFETRAIDKLSTVTNTSSAIKSMPVFHWSEHDFVFEVPVTFNAGAIQQASEGETDLRDYITVDGNVMTIKVPNGRINLDANGVYVYGNPIPDIQKGIWSPYLNSAAVSSYTTQYGWYSKLGQTVTVGFYIKATCNSGYTGTAVSISTLPFTPMFSAAGGGLCSGAYVGGNNTFQCFVAGTDGKITVRVQACNNTSATNLSTSASGCYYPSGGGELTLSGTIVYMANS